MGSTASVQTEVLEASAPSVIRNEGVANSPLFKTGTLIMSMQALETLARYKVTADSLLKRHERGDWRQCDPCDQHTNQRALSVGARVFSVYKIARKTTIWVITVADRSQTMILMPGQYL